MQQVRDKILIYQWRTLSQRIEAVFDFMRLCRKAWFLLLAVLYTPLCVALTVASFLNYSHDENYTGTTDFEVWGLFSWITGPGHGFFICVAALAAWMMFVHVYSLLAAYEDNDFCLDNATLRMLWPYVRAALLPSLVPASLLVFICLLMYAVPHPLLAVLINVLATPLALFPPVYMIKRRGSVVAFAEAFKMGFSSWFSLAFAIFLVILFGAMMLLSVNMPWMLARLFDAFSSSGEEWWYVMFLRFVAIALTIIGYLSCCMVGSMVQLYCVYHFGHMSHAQGGEESYERSIHNFENL